MVLPEAFFCFPLYSRMIVTMDSQQAGLNCFGRPPSHWFSMVPLCVTLSNSFLGYVRSQPHSLTRSSIGDSARILPPETHSV